MTAWKYRLVCMISALILLSNSSYSTKVIPLKNRKETVISFGSCSNYKQEQNPQIFNRVVEKDPDIWMWVGDVAYLKEYEKNETNTQIDYQRAKNAPNYVKLRSKMPVIGVWDDHDYGQNNGDRTYKYKDRNRRLYLDFLDEPQDSLRRTRPDGMYESYYLGEDKKIKVILLDVRYSRDPRFSLSPTADVLGEAQWAWFEEELINNPSELTLVVSGSQVLVDDRFYPEHWYHYSQQKLYETIRNSKKSGVILISGDVHYAEIMKHPCPARIGYNLYEFTSSGLTHYMSAYNLPFGGELVNAIAPYTFNKPEDRYLFKNFGMIRVNNEGPINVSLEIYDENGKLVLNRFLPYKELTFNQSSIDLNKQCILDNNNVLRIVTSYLVGMKNGDKILWLFTAVGVFGGLFVIGIGYLMINYIRKKLSGFRAEKAKKD